MNKREELKAIVHPFERAAFYARNLRELEAERQAEIAANAPARTAHWHEHQRLKRVNPVAAASFMVANQRAIHADPATYRLELYAEARRLSSLGDVAAAQRLAAQADAIAPSEPEPPKAA